MARNVFPKGAKCDRFIGPSRIEYEVLSQCSIFRTGLNFYTNQNGELCNDRSPHIQIQNPFQILPCFHERPALCFRLFSSLFHLILSSMLVFSSCIVLFSLFLFFILNTPPSFLLPNNAPSRRMEVCHLSSFACPQKNRFVLSCLVLSCRCVLLSSSLAFLWACLLFFSASLLFFSSCLVLFSLFLFFKLNHTPLLFPSRAPTRRIIVCFVSAFA